MCQRDFNTLKFLNKMKLVLEQVFFLPGFMTNVQFFDILFSTLYALKEPLLQTCHNGSAKEGMRPTLSSCVKKKRKISKIR